MPLYIQVLCTVVGGALLAGFMSLWRAVHHFIANAHQVVVKADGVVDTIAEFGHQWTAASKLADTITGVDAEVDALRHQFGDHNPDWDGVEAYLHAMRHETRNQFAGLAVTIQLLEKVVGQMTQVSAQILAANGKSR